MDSVYVGNLPPDIRIKDIDDFFRPFGKLVYIDVNHRATPIYALVQFDSPRNAFMAVKSRHGYNYEGYTLQLKFAENEVRNRRDGTPPPPPPTMFSNHGMQSNRGGSGNNFDNSNNRMGQNYSNSSTSSSFQPSQWGRFDNYSNNSRSNMPQQSSDNRMNMGQQNMMDYSSNNRSNMLHSSSGGRSNMSPQNMMDYSTNNRLNMLSSTRGRSNMPPQNTMDYSTNNRSNMSYSLNDRSNMSTQNMMGYSTNNRSNMSYSSSSARSNMPPQNTMDYSTNNRSNMSYSLNDRSNMPTQNMMGYSTNNRSNMSYSSNDRSNMSTQNMMNYSSNNRSNMSCSSLNDRSNMPQQNMMNFSNTNQSDMNYPNNGNWGNNNFGGGNVSDNSFANNATKEPCANTGFEENYTRGLSGAGRKWFNRYLKEGYSAERAREKALERRTVPYLRDDPRYKAVVNDPTNAALENIGTTIMSLLSNTTAADNFNNGNQMMPSYSNWEGGNQAGGNFDMPGPSRGRGEPRNAVSRQQYLKSLSILKEFRVKGTRSAKDRLSKKYHTQIVSDYERFEKLSGSGRAKPKTTSSSEGKSSTQLLVAFKKKKQHLLVSARKLENDKNNNRTSGAFRKRMRLLISESGFPEIEAKALAVHPLSELRVLMSMKADYEAALKNKQEKFSPIKRSASEKSTSYRNDVKYIKMHEKYRVENLSSRIKNAIRACLDRVHAYERERNLPFTRSKFKRILVGSQKRRRTRRAKKVSEKDGENNGKKNDDNAKDEVAKSGNNEKQDANTEEEQQTCGDNENITEEQPGEDAEIEEQEG